MDILPVHVRACVFILAAYGLAAIYLFFFYRYRYLVKWSILWAVVTSVTFLAGHVAIVAMAVILISLFLIPNQRFERVSYYFVLLPIVPLFIYDVPGPMGINLLLDLTYARLLTLVILGPVFILFVKQSLQGGRKFLHGSLDHLVFLYALLLCLLSFRNTTVTSGLRESLNVLMDIFIPYYVISRCIQSVNDFYKVFFAIVFTAVMLSFLGFFEQIFRWGFFRYLPDLLDFRSIPVTMVGGMRDGMLRISTTMAPLPLGYFMVLALGMLILMKDLLPGSRLFFIATVGLFLMTLFFTGSRGAWLSLVILLMVYLYLKISNQWLKWGVLSGGIGLIFFGSLLLSLVGGVDVNSMDEHGTFQYRIDLIKTSASVIKNNLLIGTPDPNAGGALESMRQGQGIIDIVNAYLEVLFYYGVIGFALFFSIFMLMLRNIYIGLAAMQQHREMRLLACMLLAMTVSTLVMIGTVSSVNFIPIYYWSLIGFASAYTRLVQRYRFRSRKLHQYQRQSARIQNDLERGFAARL